MNSPCLTLSAAVFSVLAAILSLGTGAARSAELARGEVYAVIELEFVGPRCTPKDAPARDVDFQARFRHASGSPEYLICGFWDGDGKGGSAGSSFKVRFCPTAPGRWDLVQVRSNAPSLHGQHEGDYVTAVGSSRAGFWLPDRESPGCRWYRRSDGSHPYIFGNTHYTFLTETGADGPTGSSIARDVRRNAEYFKKVRFGLGGDRYPHPTDQPFRDDQGKLTDDGDFSHRLDPHWFHARVDVAVRTACEVDLIADLIISGPDAVGSRAALRAAANHGDNTPYLRYLAARYGSYPNVWICLANEWDIKNPAYSADQVRQAGAAIRRSLPYPTPLSVHGTSGVWKPALNASPSWNDHLILQGKIRSLGRSADLVARSFSLGGGDKPVINDELGYQGAGDRFSREDVVEGHLGAFLGGGYGTTSCKPAAKKGQYFWGAFDADEHTAAHNLAWLRRVIDGQITFWKMAPLPAAQNIFSNAGENTASLAWPDHEYLLGTNAPRKGIVARLPAGKWRVRQLDAIAMQLTTLAEAAEGALTLDAPASRAALFHFRRIDAAEEGFSPRSEP